MPQPSESPSIKELAKAYVEAEKEYEKANNDYLNYWRGLPILQKLDQAKHDTLMHMCSCRDALLGAYIEENK